MAIWKSDFISSSSFLYLCLCLYLFEILLEVVYLLRLCIWLLLDRNHMYQIVSSRCNLEDSAFLLLVPVPNEAS